MKKTLFLALLVGLLLLSCHYTPVEPENQFVQINFKYGFRNELNTFENTFQKDLIQDGVAKVKFWLTEEEQNKILDKMNSINFYSLPDTFRSSLNDSIKVGMIPNPGRQNLRIKYQAIDKTMYWTYPRFIFDYRFKGVFELQNLIVSIIESKPEYKILPAARGTRN